MAEGKITDRLLVIGGSAGSLEVIIQLLPGLRKDIPFPIIIVLHRKSNTGTSLADVLAYRSGFPVKEAEDKDTLQPGMLYIAPADYHLLVEKDGHLTLDFSEQIHYSRPSIDATFESAADACGAGVIGVLLSGANADGAAGLRAIVNAGGLAVVQDPAEAIAGYMPRQAINTIKTVMILKGAEIAGYINSLY